MENSPPVLSLGQLVDENRFTYVWEPDCTPVVMKDGRMFNCYPVHNVPLIIAGMQPETKHGECKVTGDVPEVPIGSDSSECE